MPVDFIKACLWLDGVRESLFLAVQDSSIGDVVSQSVSESVSHLLISLSSEHCRADNVLVDTSRH